MMLLLVQTLPINAQEADPIQKEITRLLDSMEITGLQELAPETDLKEIMRSSAEGESPFEPYALLERVADTAKASFAAALPDLMRITGIGILSAGLLNLSAGKGGASVCELVGTILAALTASAQTAQLLTLARQTMQRITEFTAQLLPSLLALMTACGGTRSAAGLQRMTLAATGGFARFFHDILLSLLGCAAALVLADAVQEDARMNSLHKLIRNGVHWLLGLCSAVFTGCLSLQTAAGAHYDGVALRAAKYAVDKSVPIVGGLFKDAADTFIGCAMIVKNALGTAGLAALASMLMLPALRVLCASFASRACAAMLQPFGAARISRMMNGFADVLMSAFILVTGAALMDLVLIASLMYTGMEFL